MSAIHICHLCLHTCCRRHCIRVLIFLYIETCHLSFKELNELRKQFLSSQTISEKSHDALCTLEEIERAQKDFLEHGLQTVRRKLLINHSKTSV